MPCYNVFEQGKSSSRTHFCATCLLPHTGLQLTPDACEWVVGLPFWAFPLSSQGLLASRAKLGLCSPLTPVPAPCALRGGEPLSPGASTPWIPS